MSNTRSKNSLQHHHITSSEEPHNEKEDTRQDEETTVADGREEMETTDDDSLERFGNEVRKEKKSFPFCYSLNSYHNVFLLPSNFFLVPFLFRQNNLEATDQSGEEDEDHVNGVRATQFLFCEKEFSNQKEDEDTRILQHSKQKHVRLSIRDRLVKLRKVGRNRTLTASDSSLGKAIKPMSTIEFDTPDFAKKSQDLHPPIVLDEGSFDSCDGTNKEAKKGGDPLSSDDAPAVGTSVHHPIVLDEDSLHSCDTNDKTEKDGDPVSSDDYPIPPTSPFLVLLPSDCSQETKANDQLRDQIHGEHDQQGALQLEITRLERVVQRQRQNVKVLSAFLLLNLLGPVVIKAFHLFWWPACVRLAYGFVSVTIYQKCNLHDNIQVLHVFLLLNVLGPAVIESFHLLWLLAGVPNTMQSVEF